MGQEPGTKITLIFVPGSNLINGGTEQNSFEISRNSPKIKEQFSEISSYFSELNGSVPTSCPAVYFRIGTDVLSSS